MPNWCFSSINIHHDNQSQLEDFMKLLELWTSSNAMENGFGTSWLGNIVLHSGVGTIDTRTDSDLRCRGALNALELCDGYICLQTETAWAPMLLMWKKIVDKYLPDATIYYTAEEDNCGFFVTNDPYYVGKYVIDAYDIDDIESDWEASEEEAIKTLQKVLETDETDITILLEAFEESDVSDRMSIHQWEYDNEFD